MDCTDLLFYDSYITLNCNRIYYGSKLTTLEVIGSYKAINTMYKRVYNAMIIQQITVTRNIISLSNRNHCPFF